MDKIILLLLFTFSLQLNAQDNDFATVFGAQEHHQNKDQYQKISTDNGEKDKAILLIDMNFSIEEIQQANKAAAKLGKKLIVVPKMKWSTRIEVADHIRSIGKIDQKIKTLKEQLDKENDQSKKLAIQEDLHELDKKKQPKLSKVLSVVRDPNYGLQKKNLPKLFQELENDGIAIDTLVMSAHSDGVEDENQMNFYGDYNGDDTKFSRDDLTSMIRNFDGELFKNMSHLYLSSCNTLTPTDARNWMNNLPTLQSCTGYMGRAGRSQYPSVQATMYNDLTESEPFYQHLVNDDIDDKALEASNYIKDLQGEWFANMNLGHVYKDKHGNLFYTGTDKGRTVSGDADDLAIEKIKNDCIEKMDEIKNSFTPEFIELQSQITMYKLAWTNLVLHGVNKDKEIASVEDTIGQALKKYDDPLIKKQYEKLLDYDSAWSAQWMNKEESNLGLAIEFLANEMGTQNFKEKVLNAKYPGKQNSQILARIENDIQKYGMNLSDVKTADLLHDLYKQDPYANKVLVNLSKQINGAMRGRGGLKGLDEVYFKEQIDKLDKKLTDLGAETWAKLSQNCGEDLSKLEDIFSVGSCNTNPLPNNLNNILNFKPLLDRITIENFEVTNSRDGYGLKNKKTGEIKNVRKRYLKVKSPKAQCNFTFKDSELPVVSMNNIPKNGEYHIAYIGKSSKSPEQLRSELASMKNITGYKAKNNYFANFLKQNNIYTKRITEDEVKLNGNASGSNFKFDFDGLSNIDPTDARFDNGSININKGEVGNFIILSSWGNNERELNCKEGSILNNTNNPEREKKIALQKIIQESTTVAIDNTYVDVPIPFDFDSIEFQRNIEFTQRLNNGELISFDARFGEQNYYNGLTQGNIITQHNKRNPLHSGGWLTVDKRAKRIGVYREDGFLEELIDTEFTSNGSDALIPNSPSAPAGIFSVNRSGSTQLSSQKNILFLNDSRNNQDVLSIRTLDSDCQHCFKVSNASMRIIQQKMQQGYKVYVLPEEEGNYFKIKNDQLNFTTTADNLNWGEYNFTPKNDTYYKNYTQLQGEMKNNPIANTFMHTLDDEKKTIMNLYNLDNDDYNLLTQLSFGILGNESEFGEGRKLKFKEAAPGLVSILKGNGLNTDENSRGLTQIKQIPKKIVDTYNIEKSDLMDPRNAAVATIGLLAENLTVLKRIEGNHPDITPENRTDYLLYLYIGSSRQITQGSATPDQNIYIRQAKQYANDYVKVYQERVPAGSQN